MKLSGGTTQEGVEGQNNSAAILQQRLKDFEQELIANLEKGGNKEVLRELIEFLERRSQTPDRNVEIYTDPNLQTYCCAMVPAKKVLADGEIVLEKDKKTFLIGIPLSHLMGLAPKPFLLGEIQHEQGHARWTDFKLFDKCKNLAIAEGYNPSTAFTLLNCLEDARMERIVGGPMHTPERKLLFDKNSRWILAGIALNLTKMSPVEQFIMLIKAERLWEIHAKDWADIGVDVLEKPWKREDLNPDVQRLYAELEPIIAEVTGGSVLPALRNSEKVGKYLLEKLWPALKELIDKYPEQKKEEGNPVAGKGKGGGLKSGASSGNMPKEDEHFDPANPETWPDELGRILKRFIEEHERRLDEESEKNKEKAERDKIIESQRDKLKHALQKRRDGIDSPEAREKYLKFMQELRPLVTQMERVFDRYLPKVSDEEDLHGRKGKSFSVRHFVARYGSGYEKPMAYKGVPEQKGLVLQILVDISGSMMGDRIQNAVKACLVACEAAQGRDIHIEILANDEGNVGISADYILKGFDENYNGKIKQRLVEIIEKCIKGNDDAAAILAAMPRMERKMKRVRAEMDRMSGLTVFISDATTQADATKMAAEISREKSPFEGTAVSPESEIAKNVRAHFGEQSIIPRSVKEFPQAFKIILERHIRNLRSQQEE
jgi:hypothetical protein